METLELFKQHLNTVMLCTEMFLSHYQATEKKLKTRAVNEGKTLLIEQETLIDMGNTDVSFSLFQGKVLTKAIGSLFPSSDESNPAEIYFNTDENNNMFIVISNKNTKFEILTGDTTMITEPPSLESRLKTYDAIVELNLDANECKKMMGAIDLFGGSAMYYEMKIKEDKVLFNFGSKVDSRLGNLITIEKEVHSLHIPTKTDIKEREKGEKGEEEKILQDDVIYQGSSGLTRVILDSVKEKLKFEIILNTKNNTSSLIRASEETDYSVSNYYAPIFSIRQRAS